MGILSVKEINAGRTGSEDNKGVRKYHKVYRVETDDPTVGQKAVESAAGLPRRYDAYTDANGLADLAARAMAIDAQPEDPEYPYQWLVSVDYTTQVWEDILRGIHSGGKGNASSFNDPQGSSNDPQNPLNRTSEISFDGIEAMVTKQFDDGNNSVEGFSRNLTAFTNSAGDLFDPVPELPRQIPTIIIVRNQQNFDFPDMTTYWDTVNRDIFFGLSPGMVKCKSIKASSQAENGFYFWRVTYTFHIAPIPDTYAGPVAGGVPADAALTNGWNRRDGYLLDAGWRDKNGKALLYDSGGTPAKPIPLDGIGLKLSPQDAVKKYKQFVIYRGRIFGDLNL